ncbi:MAG: hypothetical protein U1E65_26850 [Myxococcota bacterium]
MADIKTKWPWPTNVGGLGTFPEEVKALQRRVEKNPDASPLAEIAPARLLTPIRSSDNLRMGEPAAPVEIQDARTVALSHVVIRRFLRKARRKGAVLFDEAVESERLEDVPENRRDQMRMMLVRESALLEILDRYNSLAEDVYMRLLAGSKG